ncbi:MAG: DMT family transporter [Magnetovibrio sp.]|nr:DMT family transporter [Magnetovibrio sp.]
MRNAWILMAVAIVFWGINWPIMKIGLNEIGPLWFAALRVSLAALVLFAYLGLRGQLRLPDRSEGPVLLSVGVLQIGVFMAMIHTAVQFVDAGRSAVLVYTTPIWAAPMAYWYLAERLNSRQVIGVLCAVAGLLALFNPFSFAWHDTDSVLGNGLLLGAAIIWAAVIVHVRGFGWSRPHLGLLPWQMVLGAAVLVPLAWTVEGPPSIPLNGQFFIIMAFNAIFATAFAFWAYLSAAKTLPANTTAMASLGVPMVGIAASAGLIGESLSPELAAGLAFIILGQIVFHRKA